STSIRRRTRLPHPLVAAVLGASLAFAACERPPEICAIGNLEQCRSRCGKADVQSCFHLALMYELGDGVAADLTRAAELYRGACERGSQPACSNLGILYERGRGVVVDFGKALELHTNACNAGEARACAR